MKSVKVTFKNGDHFTTSMNGTDEEIYSYYAVGKLFNLGNAGDDSMQEVSNCEILK